MIKTLSTACVNPWQNLAVEEWLLNEADDETCILYLWQNEKTIVIGKNQNAWRECRVDAIENESVALARRTTGGGAVFHDVGNLNFSFIMGKPIYDLTRQLSVIQKALLKFGLNVVFSGRNDILLDGRKFSGNAFAHRLNAALHHGTILLDTDTEKMARYLHVSQEKMQAKGVTSVRSRVVNLIEKAPSLTIDKIKDALFEAFENVYGKSHEHIDIFTIDNEKTRALYLRNASWQWRYGESPRFDVTFDTRFDWGNLEIGLTLEKAHIKKAAVYSDGMDPDFFGTLSCALTDCRYAKDDVISAVKSLHGDEAIINDIALWLSGRNW